ncbi:MAG: histone deacetylase [Mycobacterium sp.]
MSPGLSDDDLVWYVSYGSNMSAARFGCYLTGGFPVGARRRNPGCRDRSAPHRDAAVRLVGGLVFAGDSSVWGGGIAFYDPGADDELAARAYLVTYGQLADIVAQEVRRPVGSDVIRGDGALRRWEVPSSVYGTLLQLEDKDGSPMFTITSLKDLEPATPSAAYLRTVLQGLGEAFGWTAEERARYLLRAPGVLPGWDADSLIGLIELETQED